jgi:hypothetical protein
VVIERDPQRLVTTGQQEEAVDALGSERACDEACECLGHGGLR